MDDTISTHCYSFYLFEEEVCVIVGGEEGVIEDGELKELSDVWDGE